MPSADEVKAQLAGIKGIKSMTSGGPIRALPEVLQDDEVIEDAVSGAMGMKNGLFVVTNRRALFVHTGMIGRANVEDVARESITDAQGNAGMVFGSITVVTDARKLEVTNVPKERAPEVAERLRGSGVVERQLQVATHDWTLPSLVRLYDNDDAGTRAMQVESSALGAHGYEVVAQSEDGGHVHAGRLILTGGLSVFAGKAGIRSDGKITMTYRLASQSTAAAPAGSTLADQLRSLASLRDDGIITSEEFDAQKAKLLSQ